MKKKLHSLRGVTPRSQMDSVRRERSLMPGKERAWLLLMQAQRYWNAMDRFRRDRNRNKRYCYGDQWSDTVTVDGCRMTEEDYIKAQGSVPLKNNLIHRMVKSVLGVYRSQDKEPTCVARDRDEQKLGETMSTVLQYNMQLNQMSELNARMMEEFLISGFVVCRKWYGWRNDRMDCWTDYVQPNNFFIDNHSRDFRGWDVSFVGEVHDVSFETLAGQFAETPGDYRRLSEIYSTCRDRELWADTWDSFGYHEERDIDFFVPWDTSRCRVIEIWRKESKPRYRCHDYNSGEVYKIDEEDYPGMVAAVNAERLRTAAELGMAEDDVPLIKAEWFMDEYWYYYYLSPLGDILREGETPYAHKSHPYVFKAYPFIDCEIHSFVNDVIDQQRYVNRLITLHDWIMRASAKGALLYPTDALPEGWDLSDVGEEWSRFNGVIPIDTRKLASGMMPKQVSSNSTNIGISELLNIQLKLMEDISGVNGALQGKPGYSGMSAALYSQQTQNGTTSLLDMLEAFSSFIRDSAIKDVKNIQQFYDQKKVVNIAGKDGSLVEYDPQKIRDVEFDLRIVESTTTPVYRAMANEFLIDIWKAGQITLQQMLQAGSFPFADRLLQTLQTQQEQMERGETPEPLPEDLKSQVRGGADMRAVEDAYNAIRA